MFYATFKRMLSIQDIVVEYHRVHVLIPGLALARCSLISMPEWPPLRPVTVKDKPAS